MKDYNNLAKEIIKNVGGEENVSDLQHCITRLRFKLKDEDKANKEKLEKLEEVASVVKSGGQYQIVIGDYVTDVYKAVIKNIGKDISKQEKSANKKGILDYIGQITQPIIFYLCASGVIKGVNILLMTTGLYTAHSGIYILFDAMGQAMFDFLPVILGMTSMKAFGGSSFLGAIIGMILCMPSINGVDINLFGFVVNSTYRGTFLPVIFIAILAAFLEKYFNKTLPSSIKSFMTPTFVLVISVPLGFALIGPAVNYLAEILSNILMTVNGFSPILAGIAVGGLWQVLVVFGMHSVLGVVMMANILSGIPDPISSYMQYTSFASTAVVLAIFFKTKDVKLKQVALPAAFSGIFGVTEPAIYGVTLSRIKMFIISCLGAAVGGGLAAMFGLLTHYMAGMGIIGLLGQIDPNNTKNSVIYIAICFVATFIFSFILAYLVYKDEVVIDEKTPVQTHGKEIVLTPISGNVIPLSDVEDPVFANKTLGDGLAILPTEGKVVAPFDGEVKVLFPTNHAIGIVSDNGCELLIHIGINTVELNGKFFNSLVEQGDMIKKGDLLLEFDINEIQNNGYSTVSPIIITNTDDYKIFEKTDNNQLASSEQLFVVTR